jgi:glycosyltransferase involved in cell wall biosynthesis
MTRNIKLSVVLATRNEEKNIGDCLASVKGIADEIIVFDEESIDRTREIARSYGAAVFKVKHEAIFHITKEKALERASGEWVLQLDADERVSSALSKEILEVLDMPYGEILARRPKNKHNWDLFQRHQNLIEARDGSFGKKTGQVAAFFIPRINYFLGRPLIHAGVYPDGVIRLMRNGFAHFPAKSVHEQIQIEGEVAWLFNPLEHHDSPTLFRYLERLNRYTDLKANEFALSKTPKSFINLFLFSFIKPFNIFLNLYILHKGFLDRGSGFLWSFFSASHYPIAYFKHWSKT